MRKIKKTQKRKPSNKKKRNKIKSCGKRSFKTKNQASKNIREVWVLNMSRGASHLNKNLHSYYCEECMAWHVGHNLGHNHD